jgi:hypothetical protein
VWAFADKHNYLYAASEGALVRRLKPGRADSAGRLPVRSEKENERKQNESNHEDEHE